MTPQDQTIFFLALKLRHEDEDPEAADAVLALQARADAAEAEARTLRNASIDLLNRAEAAEKERDEYFLQWQNLRLNGTAHWQQLAEAAAKRVKELEAVLERIANESMDYQYIARAALEAKP